MELGSEAEVVLAKCEAGLVLEVSWNGMLQSATKDAWELNDTPELHLI